MKATLRTLLTGIIDYAGLFPPAKLPMEEAIRNYLRYRQEPESWLLGRFVCPAARLSLLAPHLAEMTGPPLAIAAVGQGGANMQEFNENLKADQEALRVFRQLHLRSVRVNVFEVRVPPQLENTSELKQSLTQAGEP